jgi:glutamyl-tRNA synthetase
MRSRQGPGGGYDRRYRDLDPGEAERRAKTGEPHVIRMKVPLEGECVMQDLLRGEIRREWSLVDDQVILKSDGFPTYHLAVVVDDHLMRVSHVIRGEEWINSLPKHLLLYEYLGWEPPVHCHLPLLRNPDKSKLSKRKNPTSIQYYRKAGYLPEALVNFLGLMGWVMPNGEEKFGLDDMARNLRLENISLGGPIFDTAKLRWLNGRYIREDHSPADLRRLLEGWALNPGYLDRIVPLVQPRLETLADWGRLTWPFFADTVPVEAGALTVKGKSGEEVVAILQTAIWRLEEQREWTAAALESTFRELAEGYALHTRDFNLPFYVALSGNPVWTPLYDSMEILGSDLVRMRLRAAIEALGGLSGKKQKELEKAYAARFGARD